MLAGIEVCSVSVLIATTSSASPLACGGTKVMLKEPSSAATPLPNNVPSAPCTSTRFPGVARPLNSEPSAFNASSVGVVGAGVEGTVKSVTGDAFPAASVCTRLITSPAATAPSNAITNAPFAPTTPVPMTVPAASRTSTLAPISPRPETVSPSALTTTSVTASGAVISGAWKASGVDTLPAASTSRTSMNSPLACAGSSSTVNRPSTPTTPLPIITPEASRTCTVAPGSPRPVNVTPSASDRSVG